MTEDQKLQAKIARDNELADLRFVLADKRGQRVLRRILDEGGLFARSFVGENPLTMAFTEGKRDIANFLNSEILTAAPDQWAATLTGQKING